MFQKKERNSYMQIFISPWISTFFFYSFYFALLLLLFLNIDFKYILLFIDTYIHLETTILIIGKKKFNLYL